MNGGEKRRKIPFKLFSAVCYMLFLSVFVLGSALEAEAWWHDQWQYRKRINFDTTPSGSDIKENLKEVSVLVKLHTANFNFANCKDNGEDIRFVASDDLTLLKHHIERFDSLDQVAFVWVKVNRLPGSSSQDYIYMYYGNSDAMGGQDAAGTYDPNHVAVYHLDEVDEPPEDATARENHPAEFSGGQGFPGVIGNGLTFNGASDRVIIPSSATLDFLGGFTFSTWVRLTTPVENAYIFSRESEDKAIIIGVHETKLSCLIKRGEEDSYTTEESIDIPLESWHHVAVTIAPRGRISLFLDGIEMYWADFPAEVPTVDADIVLGASTSGEHFFMGDLDEVQISNMARSPGWIRALYAAQGIESTLLSYGEEQVGGGGGLPLFYFKVIFKNITLDGWTIISLLIFMSGASWFIFLTKAFFIRLTEKENITFIEEYSQLNSLFKLENQAEEYPNSSLFRLYASGCENLKNWTGNPGHASEKGTITAKAMNAFKATLEKGFIEESKKLNAWMVVLTMAITGGPFLGLLGTVWGVMNTFAAMAEAGEANIMAIAPGVASALSTTVFGLIVAIPALFSYNYLLSRVKNIAADMTVFIDQFTLKVDEKYGSAE